MLNIFGAGQVASMAVARKQIFLFDFKIPEARLAYFDLIHQGRLPSYDEIDISTEDRGPEHLLAEFRAHNKILTHRGIERTFLEAVAIKTAKSFAGFNAPIIPAMLFLVNKAHDAMRKRHPKLNLQFEGKDREFMHSQSSSVATNGLVAVRRITSGGRVSHGQGFSGRYNQDLFVTHRRIHTILEKPDDGTQNTWAFDKLVLHAQFEDTVITGNEENSMAELVNKLFSAYIGSFEYKNSKSPRIINIERELKKTEIDKLLSSESKERITIASQASGIDQDKIYYFLKKLKHKHTDQQGLIIKQFVESNAGFTGFAAVHQLLGAHPEDISISTESGYSEVIEKANNFIIIYSYSLDNKKEKKVIFDAHKSKKNIKIIRKFYQHARVLLREIDQQLRLLYDDKYLIDHKSPLYKIYGEKKVKELVEKGVRQDKTAVKSALVSARQTILELMDLSTQKFTQKERLRIYELAKRKNLRLAEHAELFIHDNFMKIYDQQESKIGHDLLAKLETRIRALSDDTIMNELDPEYVKNQVALWMSLSEWLKKILLIWHERILVVPS
jgi:hypothetical protein